MVFSQLNWRIFRKQVAWNILFLCPAWLIGIVYCNDCDCVQPPGFFSRNCLVVYHCTCSWSITKSFTIDSFVTNSMYQKHRGRRKAYRIENAASQDASITWKNWVSIIKVSWPLVYGQAAVTYRFPSDHRSQAPSSGVSTWMGDHPGTPRAVGNTWCTRHMAKPRPQVGRVC